MEREWMTQSLTLIQQFAIRIWTASNTIQTPIIAKKRIEFNMNDGAAGVMDYLIAAMFL